MHDGVGGESPGQGARQPLLPQVNALSFPDMKDSLLHGLADFSHAPAYGLAIGGVFAVIGMVIVVALTAWHEPWLIYPFAIGFPLVGPFAAVGLFEVSRRLAAGLPLSWFAVASVVWAQRGREVSWMAFVMLFIFWMWMYQVRLLLAVILGRMSFSTIEKFLSVVAGTPEGWLFLAVGHLVGAAWAMILFSVTVVSIPLLMEREIDIVSAMITSVKVVVSSPAVMIGWGVFVTLAVLAACVPFFLGIPLVLPVLGHATWHIYRKAVRRPDAAEQAGPASLP